MNYQTPKSFQVDHLHLPKGIYLSTETEHTSTFDIRLASPYHDKPFSPQCLHSLEHGFATIARSMCPAIVQVSGMACCTGLYITFEGHMQLQLVAMFVYNIITEFLKLDKVPGATQAECGNYQFQNLEEAKSVLRRFLVIYPDPLQSIKKNNYL